jgi:hypothetical protein
MPMAEVWASRRCRGAKRRASPADARGSNSLMRVLRRKGQSDRASALPREIYAVRVDRRICAERAPNTPLQAPGRRRRFSRSPHIRRLAECRGSLRDVPADARPCDPRCRQTRPPGATSPAAGRSSRTYVHSRPVLVLPSPGARTGIGVSSACTTSAQRHARGMRRSRESAVHALTFPTHCANSVRSNSTPSRA